VRRLVLAILAILVTTAIARADGSLVWETIESPHFVIHYYRPNGDYAHRLAVVAEKAHDLLVGPLGHDPIDKTHIVVTDDTDGANGFAQVIPRNQVNVFVTAPDALDVLNDREDSIYGLIAHEYTHILHLDTIGGIPWLYNQVFGKTWSPNDIEPRWFVEGLAVYEESKRSSGGRTRSAIFDGWLRAQVLSGLDLGLDRISSSSWFWPHGNVVYLYGSFFMKYVADRFGDAAIAKITHDYGRQPIPFGLSRAAERATGETFDALWRDFIAYTRARFALQADEVKRRGLVEGRPLTNAGETNTFPRYAKDGTEIWWSRSDGWSRGQYRRIASGGAIGSDTQLAQIDGAGQFSELPDHSGMIIDRSIAYRTVYDFIDLYRYDLGSRALTRLTSGERLAGNNVSPDGKWIAAAQNGGGQQTIVVMAIDGTGAHTVWKGGRWDNAFFPAWSPDGTKLAFCAWTQGGDQDVYVLDVASGEAAKLTDDRAIDAAPRWSPDGGWIYYTSDRSGIYDVYAIELAHPGVVKQITNVLGGVGAFDLSPDGKRLVYSGIDANGGDIFELDGIDPASAPEAEVYVNDRPDSNLASDDGVPVSKPRPYNPLETLAPLAYTLQLGVDQFGDALSLGVSGGDVAGFHAYALALTYSLTNSDVSFGVGYSYGRLWPGFHFALARSTGVSGGLVVDRKRMTFHDEIWTGTAAVALPVLRRPGLNADLSLEYDLDYVRDVDPPVMQDPNTTVPTLPATGMNAGVTLRAAFSTVRRFVFSLGPAEGYSGSVGLRLNSTALGSDYGGIQLDVRWQQYFQLPWLQHILWLRYAGGVTGGHHSNYVLSGPASQDLGQAIVDSTRAGSIYFHGYTRLTGPTFQEVNLEYRAPLWVVERGLSTVPAYLNRLHAAALCDVGNAYSGRFDATKLKVGVGAALRLDLTLGWGIGGTLEVGVARGVSQGGETQTWLLLTSGL
jgi:hypothetical protein